MLFRLKIKLKWHLVHKSKKNQCNEVLFFLQIPSNLYFSKLQNINHFSLLSTIISGRKAQLNGYFKIKEPINEIKLKLFYKTLQKNNSQLKTIVRKRHFKNRSIFNFISFKIKIVCLLVGYKKLN